MSEMTVKDKRPFGFYVCCISFLLERMAYYAAKYLIFVFVAATVVTGGLGLTKVEAALIQSNLVAFTYLAPVVGGFICDRYIGARYCIPVGLLLMAGGYIIGGSATSVVTMNIMVALVAIGTGLFKGNVSAINGSLFKDEAQLDSAFSVQYSFVNVGSFIGTMAVGVLVASTFAHGGVQGFRPAFKLCGIICIIDALWFLFGMKFLGDAGKKPFKAGKHIEKKVETEVKPLTRVERRKVFAIVLVSIFSIVFWIFWYLTYLAVYDYGAQFVNMNVGGFTVPLSWFDSLNSFVCIVLGPVLAVVWFKLSKRPQGDISLFKKLAMGLSFLGLSFLMLVGAELSRGIGASAVSKANIIWIIAFGVLLSMGEMLFSPLGNSFVTKYAPNKMYSVLMGVWIFATFIAGKSYGYLYAFASKFPIMKAYIVIPIILFICGVLLFLFDKKLVRLLEDEDPDKKDSANLSA
ncbi:amino acid/peptide transporter (Peptide:H+ symporter) [Clostridium scatologenes]|uniref:Amino acid/peptide transporter (Peptide:H+ symporter) n=2 Tax=Clostridium scatologenes TaxID=1548 RepID=A0A0E3JZQ1_CLOSL|nr:peptide MFS transporter [Clostridium scatologenes]AKA69687.1 amino acid/peptide transporter (Peptide:H+ symporter) [Clostridium scatologenes]